MKNMKKFASILLALVMAMALTVPALAVTEATDVEITAPTSNNHKYEIYQIFTGALFEGKLSDIKWGQNGTDYVAGTDTFVDDDILKELSELSGSETEKSAAIAKYVNLDSDPVGTIANGEAVTVKTGYYLFKDIGPTGDGTVPDGQTLSLYAVQVVGPVTITAKDGTVEVDKKIVEEDGSKVESNEAAIGDTIKYEITGKLPANYDKFITYYYEFSDTLSTGLAFNGNVKVEMGNEDVTDWFDVTPEGKTNGVSDTAISIKCTNLKAHKEVTKDTVFVVTYTATLTEYAKVGTADGNPNTVKLIYSNDPNRSGNGTDGTPNPDNPKGETPEEKVITYTTELKITKTDEKGKILTGAEFQLSSEDGGTNIVLKSVETFEVSATGEYWKLKNGTYTTTDPTTEGINDDDYEDPEVKYEKTTTYTQVGEANGLNVKALVNADGTVTFRGLGAGNYTLSETTTPDGYNTIPDVSFEITFERDTTDETKGTFDVENVEPVNFTITKDGADGIGTFATTIVNQSGATLPETGGVGTTIFYTLGGLLVVAAGIMLVTKRRMQAHQA